MVWCEWRYTRSKWQMRLVTTSLFVKQVAESSHFKSTGGYAYGAGKIVFTRKERVYSAKDVPTKGHSSSSCAGVRQLD